MRILGVSLIAFLVAIAAGCAGGSSGPAGFKEVGNRVGSAGDPAAPASREGMAEAMVAGKARDDDPADKSAAPRRTKQVQSGILTAGSHDDNLHPEVFRKFLDKLGQNRSLGELPGRFQGHRMVITVRGGDGKPVGDARVTVAAGRGNASVDLTTRSDGRAVFLASWDRVDVDDDFTVTVSPPGGAAPVKQSVPRRSPECEVRLPGAQGRMPKNLDLALVIDATGSMGDEMDYLKAEIKGITEAIHERFPEVNQRFALIVYRDKGDSYVTRSFPFTSSLDEFRKDLAAQSAGGGGDIPEAMDQALEDAGQLQWRDAETARVLFLVADAPPHAENVGRAMTAADRLRKRGVALYPIAASGYDEATEFVMRTSALLSGGQFLFLTDDSGVGNAHAEPHITDYHVQRLDQMMIRMIAGELAGQRIDPKPDEIIRTVGKPRSAAGQQ